MNVKHLTLNSFRNFSTLEFDPSSGVNILYGDNGAGKTNLLESLFVLCLGRSHRGSADRVMVKSDSDYYYLEGSLNTGEEDHRVSVGYQLESGKKLTINKVKIKTADLYEKFCTVAVGPEDSDIISGPPSRRRNFIDIYLSQLSRKYLYDLFEYRRILIQKNAALKDNLDPSPFTLLMIDCGSKIIKARGEFLKNMGERTADFYNEISGGGSFILNYEPSVKLLAEDLNIDMIKKSFEVCLDRVSERERIIQTALIGPHRDEVGLHIDGFPARGYASQGEWRTAAICLKLAVYQILKENRQTTPLLLMDEIFAELDEKRTGGLINAFGDFGQLFLTTAVKPPEELLGNSRSFKITEGRIEEVA